MSDNIQVAVRLRPLNKREIAMNAKSIIKMDKSTQQTFIENPEDGKVQAFTFDYSCKYSYKYINIFHLPPNYMKFTL